MDSLAHEIMNASAFDIANSMIHADISEINITTRHVIDDGNSNGDDNNSGFNQSIQSIQSGNIDFTVSNRLVVSVDDEESFTELVHQVGNNPALNDGSSNTGVSTRLRRRKATQPQRLVYCDLDFNLNEDANLGGTNTTSINDPIANQSHLLNNDNHILNNNHNHVETSQYEMTICTTNDDGQGEMTICTTNDDGHGEMTICTTNDDGQGVADEIPFETNGQSSPAETNNGQTKQKSKGFQCEICGSFWNSKTRLRCHYRTHGAAKHLKCDICGKLFGWEYSWKTHMLAHSEHNPNKCPHCGLKLFNKTALTNHIKRIHDNPDRPFKCVVCSKSFISKSELNQHSHTHSEDKPFMCEQCGKTFRSKNYMERHYKTHSGVKPFKCEYCGKLLADKTGFTAHIRAHVGERPYMCDICGKKYTIKRHLTSHMIIHSDLRPFKCEQCGKTFRSRTNFRMHKDSHLGIKRWSCKFCNRTFLSQGNMAKHVRRHIGERKHKCHICGKGFIEKQELKNHSKIHLNHENKDSKLSKVNNDSNQQINNHKINHHHDNHSTNEEESISTSNGETTNDDVNSLNLNHFRDVILNNEQVTVEDDINGNSQNQNHHLLTTLQSPISTNVQLPPIHLSITNSNSQSLTMSQVYTMENTHNIDTTLSFCDYQRSESNRNTFYLNPNQASQPTTPQHSQSLLSTSFFPSQTTTITSNTTPQHGQYLTDSTQQSFLHCSLCSAFFVTINNLREHLLEFHRVETDKILSMIY